MKCLIIAAGQGTRLSGVGDSKPLVPLLGKPLIVRVIETAEKAGITEFIIVTGYRAEKIRAALLAFSHHRDIAITFIHNDQWDKPNGISVLSAAEQLREPFFLVMSDHMFDPAILERFKQVSMENHDVRLAVDTRIVDNPLVDLEDVTKVWVDSGNIINIGKTIQPYNAFDTGIFYCKPGIFAALEESIRGGDASLSGGIRVLAAKGRAGVMDIGDSYWIDVDNENMLKKAHELLTNKVMSNEV